MKFYRKENVDIDISNLIGTTLLGYHIFDDDDEKLIMFYDDFYNYTFYHDQDCCENVFLEGENKLLESEIKAILNSPIVLAEARTDTSNSERGNEYSETFTFYTLRTHNDTLTLRFVGRSNGYYSERVDICASLRENLSTDFI